MNLKLSFGPVSQTAVDLLAVVLDADKTLHHVDDPVLAGHVMSAFIGVSCAKSIPNTELAGACAVGLAIGAMHQFKCIHPPGGATALTAVVAGPSTFGVPSPPAARSPAMYMSKSR